MIKIKGWPIWESRRAICFVRLTRKLKIFAPNFQNESTGLFVLGVGVFFSSDKIGLFN